MPATMLELCDTHVKYNVGIMSDMSATMLELCDTHVKYNVGIMS